MVSAMPTEFLDILQSAEKAYIRFLLGFVPSLLYTLAVPLSPSWSCDPGPVLASRV
jgi:hypothetical protein